MLRRVVPNEWLLILAGILTVVFGILLSINPAAEIVTLVWLFAIYMIVFGALALALALRLRSNRATLVVGGFN